MWITNYCNSFAFNFDKVTGIRLETGKKTYMNVVFFGSLLPDGALRMGLYTAKQAAEIFRDLMESHSNDRVYRLPVPAK